MFIITKQVELLKLQMIASCTTWSFVAFFSHHKQNEEVFSRVSKDMFANDIIRYIDSFEFFFTQLGLIQWFSHAAVLIIYVKSKHDKSAILSLLI